MQHPRRHRSYATACFTSHTARSSSRYQPQNLVFSGQKHTSNGFHLFSLVLSRDEWQLSLPPPLLLSFASSDLPKMRVVIPCIGVTVDICISQKIRRDIAREHTRFGRKTPPEPEYKVANIICAPPALPNQPLSCGLSFLSGRRKGTIGSRIEGSLTTKQRDSDSGRGKVD